MFEEYLQDANMFLEHARTEKNNARYRISKCFYRASVFSANSALEAFLNYIADSLSTVNTIPRITLSYLNDKIITFKKGKQISKTEYHRLDEKLRILLTMFVPDYDYTSATWSRFQEFKKFRNSLIHPKQLDDDIEIPMYEKQVSNGLTAIIEIINCLALGFFGKPLRRQLLDLIPE